MAERSRCESSLRSAYSLRAENADCNDWKSFLVASNTGFRMYQSHFHLNVRPFSSAANPEHYFPAGSIEQARESIARNVERNSNVTIVTGPVGCGKTLLCQLIANQFTSELPVCLVPGESLHAPEDLLQSILHKLGLPFRGQDAGELRLILSDHISSPGCINGILLVIDDADRLNNALLDEVRAVTNVVKEGQSCARVLLVGSPRLDENLSSPPLESLSQRIAGRSYLDSFTQQETSDYVHARITSSGGDGPGLFTDASLAKVHAATNGVPRLVNQICDHALMLAAINDIDQMTPRLIEEAWADLQQLPLPALDHEILGSPETTVSTGATSVSSDESCFVQNTAAIEADDVGDHVIEFGSLDEAQDISELAEIEQTLSALGGEVSQASRPLVVGGDFQFEPEHGVTPSFPNTVLPFQSPTDDSGETKPDAVDGVSETPELKMPEVTDASEEQPGHDTDSATEYDAVYETPQTLDDGAKSEEHQQKEYESPKAGIDSQDVPQTIAFESAADLESQAESQSFGGHEEERGDAEVQSTVEFAFEVDDDLDQSSPEDSLAGVELLTTAVQGTFDQQQGYASAEESADPETICGPPVAMEPASDGIVDVHDSVDLDPTQDGHEQFVDSELSLQSRPYESADADVVLPPQIELPSASVAVIDPPEYVSTIDEANSPFGDTFAEEEVVVQNFVSPSAIAKDCYDPVTTAYSRQLSLQLAEAYPGLRMHPASIALGADSMVAEQDDFQPLSACFDDEPLGAMYPSYSPQNDPVMPDQLLEAMSPPEPSDDATQVAPESLGNEWDDNGDEAYGCDQSFAAASTVELAETPCQEPEPVVDLSVAENHNWNNEEAESASSSMDDESVIPQELAEDENADEDEDPFEDTDVSTSLATDLRLMRDDDWDEDANAVDSMYPLESDQVWGIQDEVASDLQGAQAATQDEDCEATWADKRNDEAVVASIGVQVAPAVAPETVQAPAPKKRIRLFRTLFSGMRSKQQ